MEDVGVIVAVTGKRAKVRIELRGICANCVNKALCAPQGGRETEVEALNLVGASVGDKVRLEMNPGASIASALIVFVLPVMGIILGYFAGDLLWKRGMIGAFLGLFLFLGMVKLLDRVLSGKNRFQPAVTRIIQRAGEGRL